MEGIEDEDEEGVSENEELGVRRLVGVENSSRRLCRDDGVCGNKIEFLEGVPALLEGVIGKGTAKSRSGRLEGDLEGDLENGEGDEGVASIDEEEGDFGDDDASSRVNVEGFAGVGREGSKAMGTTGMESLSL